MIRGAIVIVCVFSVMYYMMHDVVVVTLIKTNLEFDSYLCVINMNEPQPILGLPDLEINSGSPGLLSWCFFYRKTLPICTFRFPHVLTTLTTFTVLLRILYTIDIPPRLRKLHNHFLFDIPFKLLLFIYLSRFFGEIR
jgi:hypothetical protein